MRFYCINRLINDSNRLINGITRLIDNLIRLIHGWRPGRRRPPISPPLPAAALGPWPGPEPLISRARPLINRVMQLINRLMP